MSFVLADWSISRSTKIIDYIGDGHTGTAPSYATGIEFHRGIQDLADQSIDSGDDEMSIIDDTPTDRAGADTNIVMTEGYTITQTASEHLYDCSITQDNGNKIWDGIQVFSNASTIQIMQNGSLIADDFWNNPKMKLATSDSLSGTTHRFMIEVRTGGSDIDGRRIIGTQREYGTQFTEFPIGGGTNRGNNTLALKADTDNNNQTASGTVATYTDIVNDNEGYNGIDANGDTTNEFYYSNWELGSRSPNDFYEYAKYIQREGTAETLYGLDGDVFRGITHEIDIDSPSGTFVEPEALSWSGGTAQLLAIDSVTAGTKMWIQLLTGVVPTNNTVITGASGATASVDVNVVSRIVPSVFIGASTGTAILGAFGVGVGADDLTNADKVVDLTGTTNNPPNNVQFVVSNLVVGDRILVANNDANNVDLDQFSLNTTLNGASETSVVLTTTIDSDTPTTGTIRVQNDTGRYILCNYTSFTGSTFTITSTDFSTENATAGKNVFISYIDKVAAATTESFTVVYNSDRTLFVRVRNATAQIKTAETTGTLSSGGGGATIGRISDS